MPGEYLTDGDSGFVGLNSRDNPSALPMGILSKAVNVRMDRGVASVRRGLVKYTDGQLWSETKKVVGTGVYRDTNGVERTLIVYHDSLDDNTYIFSFNPDQGDFSTPTQLVGAKIRSPDGCVVVAAYDKVFITRGHDQRPIVWDRVNSFDVLQEHSESHKFPNCSDLLFFKNRLVAVGKHPEMDAGRERDTICVSHFLDFDKWDLADAFTINQGGNDRVVTVVPWTMNEFLVLCRNSTFYLNTGSTRYTQGAPLAEDARLELLSSDVGCVAAKSAVQIADGVLFLSDNGVYFLKTLQGTNPDGLKLLTLSEPLSAPVDDVIKRINKDFAEKAVGSYWNNRYYLAIPVDGSEQNNAILVYNFILKNWESLDFYPEGVDVLRFSPGKINKENRLFIIDSNEGVFLMEEAVGDETGLPTGTPVLNLTETVGPYSGLTGAYLPFKLTLGGYSEKPIRAEIVTRRLTAGTGSKKRFSSIETDIYAPEGVLIQTSAIVYNPDSEYMVDSFQTGATEDFMRRNPVRKHGYGIQTKFVTSNGQPVIRSNYIKFTSLNKNNQNNS